MLPPIVGKKYSIRLSITQTASMSLISVVAEGYINSQPQFLKIGGFCLINLVLNKTQRRKNHMLSSPESVGPVN